MPAERDAYVVTRRQNPGFAPLQSRPATSKSRLPVWIQGFGLRQSGTAEPVPSTAFMMASSSAHRGDVRGIRAMSRSRLLGGATPPAEQSHYRKVPICRQSTAGPAKGRKKTATTDTIADHPSQDGFFGSLSGPRLLPVTKTRMVSAALSG